MAVTRWLWVAAATVGIIGGLVNYLLAVDGAGTAEVQAAARVAALLVLGCWAGLGLLWLVLVAVSRGGRPPVHRLLVATGLLGLAYDLSMLAGSWVTVMAGTVQIGLLIAGIATLRREREPAAGRSR